MTEKHIHTWNKYIDGKLCCSNCDLPYNTYLYLTLGVKE